MYNTDFLIKNQSHQPFFMIMVGIPGSGKTTIAKEIADSYSLIRGEHVDIVSSDAIREELLGDENIQNNNKLVFNVLHKRIKKYLGLRHNVIVDATNISRKSRTSLLSLVGNKNYFKIAYIVDTALKEAKERNRKRSRVVPEFVLDKMVYQFQIPFYEEGFNSILLHNWEENKLKITLKSQKSFEWTSEEDFLFQKLVGFDQRNHHHKYTLDVHSKILYNLARRYHKNNQAFCRAACLHDIGKLFVGKCKEDGSGEYSYLSHHNYGTYFLFQYIPELGLKNMDDVLDCLFYVNYHMEPFFWYTKITNVFGEESKIITEKTLVKMKQRYGATHLKLLLEFNAFDKEASGTHRGE